MVQSFSEKESSPCERDAVGRPALRVAGPTRQCDRLWYDVPILSKERTNDYSCFIVRCSDPPGDP